MGKTTNRGKGSRGKKEEERHQRWWHKKVAQVGDVDGTKPGELINHQCQAGRKAESVCPRL